MEILKPEDKTLELLATELGFVVWEKADGSVEKISMDPPEEKNRKPAMIKPFTQLT